MLYFSKECEMSIRNPERPATQDVVSGCIPTADEYFYTELTELTQNHQKIISVSSVQIKICEFCEKYKTQNIKYLQKYIHVKFDLLNNHHSCCIKTKKPLNC